MKKYIKKDKTKNRYKNRYKNRITKKSKIKKSKIKKSKIKKSKIKKKKTKNKRYKRKNISKIKSGTTSVREEDKEEEEEEDEEDKKLTCANVNENNTKYQCPSTKKLRNNFENIKCNDEQADDQADEQADEQTDERTNGCNDERCCEDKPVIIQTPSTTPPATPNTKNAAMGTGLASVGTTLHNYMGDHPAIPAIAASVALAAGAYALLKKDKKRSKKRFVS